MILRRILTVFLLLLPLTSLAETLHGRVFDTRESEVLAEVRVVLQGATARETVTDENGFYRFDDLEPGAYLVRIYLHGDEAVLSRLGVQAGRPTLHHFNLANIGHPHHDDEY